MDELVKVDLGREVDYGLDSPGDGSEDKKTVYPELYLADTDLPELPDGDFWVKALVRKKRYSVEYDDDGNKSKDCSLEVKKLGLYKKSNEPRDSVVVIAESMDRAYDEMEG